MTDVQIFYNGPIVNRMEAIRLGEKFYFTGVPCKHGHISRRKVAGWLCIQCSKMKYAHRVSRAKVCGHLTKKGRQYCPPCREKLYSEVKPIPCMTCGKLVNRSKSEAKKYKNCSMRCRNIAISKRQSGSKSHLWRGGLTDQNRKSRNSAKYDNWRRAVMERDGYKCVECGIGGKLCADHIKEWFLYPGLRFEVENGRTLCVPCHRKTESFGSKAAIKKQRLEVGGKLQYMLL